MKAKPYVVLNESLVAAGCLTVGSVIADTAMVDPCFPLQMDQTVVHEPVKGWLPGRIRQLRVERDELIDRINVLPLHNPKPLSDHHGYHSLPLDISPSNDTSASRIHVRFEFYSKLDSIALVPALVHGDSQLESYTFPKRFKIEVLESRGRWVGNDPGRWVEDRSLSEWVEVVNWMDEDFPDPGPYPVFFIAHGQQVYEIRMTIPYSNEIGEFHALGEIYLFRRDQKGRAGNNMMGWGDDVKVTATDSLSKPPLWDVEYLRDGVTGLGLPLSEETSSAEDLMVTWDKEDPVGPVQITMDLGELRQVGGVHFWPAEAPYGMDVPLFGFPKRVSVELSADPDFSEVRRVDVQQAQIRMHRDNLLVVATRAYEARYVRITLDDLEAYQNRRILGLGEVRVIEYNDVWSTGCEVRATGLPDGAESQLPRLVDGYSRHRRILSEAERIKGLAKRRPLDRRLEAVKQELLLAEGAWRALLFRLSISGGIFLLLALVVGWRAQRRQRMRELSKLKQRITRDLHDEVGSSLGGISLMSEELESMAENKTVKEELRELTLMAREACSSLREVVWMTDEDLILLPALIGKLVERAERTLRGMKLSVETSQEIPLMEVALNFKRHLIMFFREAVHNCARHSRATEVKVSAMVDSKILQLAIRDNGCGFDASKMHSGWGLASMKKRAEELGGKLEVVSDPGTGTSIILRVPLETVSQEPSKAYKTSNEFLEK